MTSRVVVMTKVPIPGQVKTRLIPALGEDGACRLHSAMVDQTLARVSGSALPCTVAVAGPMGHPFVLDLIDRGFEVEPQIDGDLGARLRHALRRTGPQIALGTDCPVFLPTELQEAATAPEPVSIGPTLDGGYWLIKVHGEVALHTVFNDIPWSTPTVCSTTQARARIADLPIHWLPTRYDVDDATDLVRLQADPGWAGDALIAGDSGSAPGA